MFSVIYGYRADLAGVTNTGLAQTLNAYFSGHYITTFREGDHFVPVYLRLPPEQRGSLNGLRATYVEGLHGKVLIDTVADIRPEWKPAKIERRFLQRVIEVCARVEVGYRANDIVLPMLDSEAFKQWKANLPPGYWWEIGRELFESRQPKGELRIALIIAVLAIVLLLIIQYNGFAKPVIIITTIPLGSYWCTLWRCRKCRNHIFRICRYAY